jgi:predicted metal-binding membrane protein
MIERLLARDRTILLSGIVGISALAWLYTAQEAGAMHAMHAGMDMTGVLKSAWTWQDALLTFLMWTVMMAAMMTPSAAPVVLIYALHSRKLAQQDRPYVPAGFFLAGYLLVWTGFSLLATFAQWVLQQAALLSMMMEPIGQVLPGIIFLTAGIYQWTPLKRACLRHCRSPLSLVIEHWKPGTAGALLMGIRHGAYCAACCWFLMALLFAAGVMNLLCVAVIALFVLVEKAAPGGEIVARIAGALLTGVGLWSLLG